MSKKKRKHAPRRQGHYCRVCGEHKANEKFSGRGHAAHICKACHALPLQRRNEIECMTKIDHIQEDFFISKENLKRLKKYANDKRYPEASKYAQDALDAFYKRMDEYHGNTSHTETAVPVLFSELSETLQKETVELIEERLAEFIGYAEYIPDKDDVKELLGEICQEISAEINAACEPEPYSPYDSLPIFAPSMDADAKLQLIADMLEQEAELDEDDWNDEAEEGVSAPTAKELVVDNSLYAVFDAAMSRVIEAFRADGFDPPTFLDTLQVAETERLLLRQFAPADYGALYAIMKKPEVMYAWEHGFTKGEVKTWIGKQQKRYRGDGYGYFAVIQKETSKLIGQAGILKSSIDGKTVVEIGYIFDDTVWGQGYAYEAATACIRLAFGEYNADTLYCLVRPENEPSIRLAKRLGFVEDGQMIKVYRGKEMPHVIFKLECGAE